MPTTPKDPQRPRSVAVAVQATRQRLPDQIREVLPQARINVVATLARWDPRKSGLTGIGMPSAIMNVPELHP
jgi:hypothetical protein